MSEEEVYEIKIGQAKFTFGTPCPPIQSQFFPIENLKEKTIGDQDDSSQSA
jgi:hypothetical protein